jgi:hypothetical protein
VGVETIKFKITTLILVMFIFIVAVSGCTEKKATNGTWGEKAPATADSLKIINATADHYDYNGTTYYYVGGYIQNSADSDASNVKMVATFYDASGKVVATNDTFYIKPTTIPAAGQSRFYVKFEDPDNKITSYDVKVTSAQ